MIASKIMIDSKDNPKKQPAVSNCDSDDKAEKQKKPESKKTRLKFKEEDMIKMEYNF